MKKKVLSLLLVSAMAASMVAGCGASDKEDGAKDTGAKEPVATSEAESQAEEAKELTVTVMGPAEDLDDAQGAWLKAQCEAFNAEHPNWNLTFEYVTGSEGEAKDIVSKDPSAAADVYLFANDQIADLVACEGIAKLGGAAAEQVKNTNTDTVTASVTYAGDIYGIPYTHNTWFMYYDKRVISDEDATSMEKMLEKGKVSFPLDNGWYLSAFYTANGCTFYGDGTDQSANIDFEGEKAQQVTDYIVDLVNNKNFVMDANDGSIGLAGLADGSVNVFFNGNWNYDSVCEKLGGAENVGVAALPTININGKDCQMKAFYGSKAIGVNPNAKDSEVAVKLAMFLGNEASQTAHYTTRKQIPVDTNAIATLSSDPVAKAFADMADHASIVQPIFGMGEYWTVATPFGAAFAKGAEDQTTHDNSAKKTEDFFNAINKQ